MKELFEIKTVQKDAHHYYIYNNGHKTPIPDDGVVFCYLSKAGMLKATDWTDIAGSVEGKFVMTDEITAEKGKPCIGGTVYDVWGIGKDYVTVSKNGDKYYFGAANANKVVTHPNQKGKAEDYKLIHAIYSMLCE